MSALNDQQARQQAINPHHSFAVSAPAGSGKTELLIQRTLSLLGSVDQPEAILGITFTRKAASEMRERISNALGKASRNEPVKNAHEQLTRDLAAAALQRDQQLGWGLLQNPSRLRFLTIDGLCRQLATQLCLETGIVVPPEMTQDAQALSQQAAERLIEHLEESGPVGEQLRTLVAHLDGNLEKLVSLVSNLLASRDSWLPLVMSGRIDADYLAESVDKLIEEILNRAAQSLLPFIGEIEELLDFACRYRQGADWLPDRLINEVPQVHASELARWKALHSFLMTQKGEFRGSVNVRLGFPTQAEGLGKDEARARKEQMGKLLADMAADTELKTRLQRIANLPEMNIDQSGPINQALFAILPIAAVEFDLLCQEKGETDYTAVAMAALQALGTTDDPTPLALRLDYRIAHILVDEFQDTSSMQVELLRRLTSGWSEGDGRTLFIVGDGMQSIYGFRKANVSLFIRARRDGIEHVQMQPLDLTANFRSDAQIVDWVNQSFSQIFPAEDNLVQGQVAFKQAQATGKQTDWQVKLQGFASEIVEAEQVAADIEAKLALGETDIALLVRGRSHLREILPALRSRNIAWQAQNIDQLSGRMAVMDIYSLTRAVCVPADRIAWLSVLRAPWAGLSMSDLLCLAQWQVDGQLPGLWTALGQHSQIGGLSQEGQQSCQRLVQCFRHAFDRQGNIGLRPLIEDLWRLLDGDQALLEAREQEDVADYLDLLEQMESGGTIADWMRFETKLTELYSRPTLAGNAVQIMTIHSAKGLEFDHVYLPCLHRLPRSGAEAPLLLWWQREFEDGDEAYLLSTKPALGSDKDPDLYNYLKSEENERQRQEIARLLYVAATRAKKSLFITAKLNWNEKKEMISTPDSRSMLSILWPMYEDQFTVGFQPALQADKDEASVLTGIRRLDPGRPLPELAAPTKTTSRQSPAIYSYESNYLARICGDLIHLSLMRIVREQIEQPSSELFVDDWNRGLTGRGLNPGQKQQALDQLDKMLAAVITDKTGRWLLDWNHDQSAAELEMDYLNDFGGLQRAIIDRTFVENGSRWIIDYKSSSPTENQSLDNFLQQEVQTYQSQLQRYAALFDEPVKTMLYFPAIPAHIEIQS